MTLLWAAKWRPTAKLIMLQEGHKRHRMVMPYDADDGARSHFSRYPDRSGEFDCVRSVPDQAVRESCETEAVSG
jgi:hypothetical protein